MADLNLPGTPASPRQQQLGQLSQQVSQGIGANAQQQQNQRMAGLQDSIQKATAAGLQAGAIGLQAAAQNTARQGQVGALGLQDQAQTQQASLAQQKLELDKTNADLQNQLAQKNQALKQELIDKQTQFAKDEMGRTVYTDRQLMDWQITKAKTHEDLLNYEQQAHQMSDRKMQMLRTAHAVISQAMQQASENYNNSEGNALRVQLQKDKEELELKMQKEAAAAANRAAMFQAGGTILGTAIGAFGGPAGAMAGGAIGGGVGSIASNSKI
jgi:hypothetical protein